MVLYNRLIIIIITRLSLSVPVLPVCGVLVTHSQLYLCVYIHFITKKHW